MTESDKITKTNQTISIDSYVIEKIIELAALDANYINNIDESVRGYNYKVTRWFFLRAAHRLRLIARVAALAFTHSVDIVDRRWCNVRFLVCATTQPADACEWYHRQRRLVVGIIGKLVPMILFTFTGEAPNRHQRLDYRLCQSDYLHLPPYFEATEYRKAA